MTGSTRWVCPLCGRRVPTFWHDGSRIFTTHGGDILEGDCCEASGWIVEPDLDRRIEP